MHLGKSPCHLKKFYSEMKLGTYSILWFLYWTCEVNVSLPGEYISVIPWKLDFLQIRIFTAFLLYYIHIFRLWMDVLIFQKWSWTTTTPFKIYVTLSFNEHALRETKLRFEKSVNSEIWKSGS